jgi:hypothetical protein
MVREQEIRDELLASLVSAINGLPGGEAGSTQIEVHFPRNKHVVDALMQIKISGQEAELVIEVKQDTFPRDTRDAVWLLKHYLELFPTAGNRLPILVARSVSKGAREILQNAEVGYHDLGGSLFLPMPGAYFLIDRPPFKGRERAKGSIFKGQKARVVQEVIAEAGQWLGVTSLAERTEVSPATVSETLSEMERRDWLETEGAGPTKVRRLIDRDAVLDEWVRQISIQKPPKMHRYYVRTGDHDALARRLDEACREVGAAYAVTAEAAAQAYAPYLTSLSQLKCRIEPGRVQDRALAALDARPVTEGWNLGVIETRARGDITVGERLEGIAVAPPVQVYLDLLQGSGRAKEMAEHLRSERLSA